MDHLSDTLHFMKMNVFYNKLPISIIDKVMDAEGHLNDETLRAVNKQIDEFLIY
jgi:chromate reductase, NAD(P)H dehydrogenase (quinone)